MSMKAMRPEELLPRLPWRPAPLICLLVMFPKTNVGVCLRIRHMMKHLREHAKWMKRNAPYGAALEDEFLAVIYAWVQQRTAHILREEPMIRSCALAAISGIALFSSISFAHAEPLPTETFKILPAALAVEAAQAAIASCKAQGYTVSVAIVDRAGNLKLLLVGDSAGALTPGLSRRKAYTAAMRRVSTGELAKQVAAPGAFNPTLYDRQLVTVVGGVPIRPATKRSELLA